MTLNAPNKKSSTTKSKRQDLVNRGQVKMESRVNAACGSKEACSGHGRASTGGYGRTNLRQCTLACRCRLLHEEPLVPSFRLLMNFWLWSILITSFVPILVPPRLQLRKRETSD